MEAGREAERNVLYQCSNAKLLYYDGPAALIRTSWERVSRRAVKGMEEVASLDVDWIGRTTLHALKDWVTNALSLPSCGSDWNCSGRAMYDGRIGDLQTLFGAEIIKPHLGEFRDGEIDVGTGVPPFEWQRSKKVITLVLKQQHKRLCVLSRTAWWFEEARTHGPKLELNTYLDERSYEGSDG